MVVVYGPVLPSILEISYSLVYTLAPFSVAVLYLTGRRDRVDRFLFIFVLSVLLCYAQFPFWPSEPPRVVFFGQDSPTYDTIFRRFNLWMLGNYGIHTSVFPSAHVAGAFAQREGSNALPFRDCHFDCSGDFLRQIPLRDRCHGGLFDRCGCVYPCQCSP